MEGRNQAFSSVSAHERRDKRTNDRVYTRIPFRTDDWMMAVVMVQVIVWQWMMMPVVREISPTAVCRTLLTSLRCLESSWVQMTGWCKSGERMRVHHADDRRGVRT